MVEKFSSQDYLSDHGFIKEMEGKGGRHGENKDLCNFSCLDFTMKYVQENGFNQPMVFHSSSGLGMRYSQ